jgi:citrate synthase
MWLSASEATNRWRVKAQTLYANVSRGRIRTRPDPADPRRRLYSREDIERLARKGAERRPAEAVAAETIRWGEPVLETRISTIAGGRLIYRGEDAVALAESASLEDVAALLWSVPAVAVPQARKPLETGLAAAFSALAARAASDPPSLGRPPAALRMDALSVLGTVAAAISGAGDGPLHERLAGHWQRPAAADALRRALVLLADHELNASTFAARVAVSTGASLAAGTLAALAVLSGPLHGRASAAVRVLVEDLQSAVDIPGALRDWLGEGRAVPGFGHPLYRDGDVRAAALLDRLAMPHGYAQFRIAAEDFIGEAANVDFALAALTATYELPETAPIQIFALARCAGWLAQMLEQGEIGALIRPRARYIGPKPPAT